jgi:hypothetical protein
MTSFIKKCQILFLDLAYSVCLSSSWKSIFDIRQLGNFFYSVSACFFSYVDFLLGCVLVYVLELMWLFGFCLREEYG